MIDWFLNLIGWGDSYEVSWWGNVNEPNGWGIIYPFNADGSNFRVDTNLISADNNQYTSDKTQY